MDDKGLPGTPSLDPLRLLFDRARDIILVLKRDGRIVDANEAAIKAYGYSRDELLSMTIQQLRVESPLSTEAQLEQAGTEGLLFEAVHRRRDGTTFPVEVSSQGANLGTEQVLLSIIRDIGERKRAEEALARSEENFRRVFEQSPIGTAIVSLDYRFQRVNQALCDLTGYSSEELTSMGFTEITYPEDLSRSVEAAERLAAGEIDCYQMDKRYIRKDGKIVWIQLTTSIVRDAAGHPLYYLSNTENITQRKQAEQEREGLLSEVQRRAAELDATIESIPDGVIIYQPSGEILRMNSAAEKMLGYADEDRAKPMKERLSRLRMETADGKPLRLEDSPPWRASHGETVRGAIVILHPPHARTIWIASSAAPLRSPGGELLGSVGVMTDITALHHLQEQRSKYILGISHGLRTPLTVVQGQSQLLLRALAEAGLNGHMKHSAETVIFSARRMSVLLRDLVDLMALDSGEPLKLNVEPVDLQAFLLELMERLSGLMETQRIRLHSPKDLPRVLADPDRLERILINLLSNALKYSDPGTPVDVTISLGDGEVLVRVTDRGQGISAEQLPHIFEPYRRRQLALERQETIGLGLYVARGLVEAQGGQIWVESEVGKGSTFTISLPVSSGGDRG